MDKPHRIAAGGIVFKEGRVLLVRYPDQILVCPGGKLEEQENLIQATIREVKEESGVLVNPLRVLAIEDLLTSQHKMIKIWMLCQYISGEIQKSPESEKEGIVEAGWYTRDQLLHEIVYPALLLQNDWDWLQSEKWQVLCLPTRIAKF